MMNSLLACTSCAKSFEEAGGNAAGMSILFLLVVIVGVLGGIGFLMARIGKREKANLDPRFVDELGT